MSKKLFERLNNMSVDEIINEDFENERSTLTEEFDHPFTIEETEQYFLQGEDGLTEEEMYELMNNKMKELWENDCYSST